MPASTGYAALVQSMTNDKKDRHVLAAAVRTGAHAILTENVKHFPRSPWRHTTSNVLTPDQFLAYQFHLNRELLEREAVRPGNGSRDSYEALVHRLANWAPSLPKLLLESA